MGHELLKNAFFTKKAVPSKLGRSPPKILKVPLVSSAKWVFRVTLKYVYLNLNPIFFGLIRKKLTLFGLFTGSKDLLTFLRFSF